MMMSMAPICAAKRSWNDWNALSGSFAVPGMRADEVRTNAKKMNMYTTGQRVRTPIRAATGLGTRICLAVLLLRPSNDTAPSGERKRVLCNEGLGTRPDGFVEVVEKIEWAGSSTKLAKHRRELTAMVRGMVDDMLEHMLKGVGPRSAWRILIRHEPFEIGLREAFEVSALFGLECGPMVPQKVKVLDGPWIGR